MDEVHSKRTEALAEAYGGGSEPFGEGAEIGAKEGVGSVEEAVVRAKRATRDVHQRNARAQRVHRVRTRARHRRMPNAECRMPNGSHSADRYRAAAE